MKMSVREARANFAAAIEAAKRGERVTITDNGKPVAELGPTQQSRGTEEGFWERSERVRAELGLKDIVSGQSAEEWLDAFNDPAWTREIFGPDYFDDAPEPE